MFPNRVRVSFASVFIITADEGLRGGRKVPLKVNVDAAIERAGNVDHVLVVRRTGTAVSGHHSSSPLSLTLETLPPRTQLDDEHRIHQQGPADDRPRWMRWWIR